MKFALSSRARGGARVRDDVRDRLQRLRVRGVEHLERALRPVDDDGEVVPVRVRERRVEDDRRVVRQQLQRVGQRVRGLVERGA